MHVGGEYGGEVGMFRVAQGRRKWVKKEHVMHRALALRIRLRTQQRRVEETSEDAVGSNSADGSCARIHDEHTGREFWSIRGRERYGAVEQWARARGVRLCTVYGRSKEMPEGTERTC